MGEAEDIPIIIISGDKSAKYRKRIQAAKVVGFFPKPIDHIALVDTIRTALGEDAGDKPPGRPDRLKDKARLNSMFEILSRVKVELRASFVIRTWN